MHVSKIAFRLLPLKKGKNHSHVRQIGGKMNRRGSLFDMPYLILAFFMVGIIILAVGAMFTMFNTNIQAMDNSVIPTDAKAISTQMSGQYSSTMDWVFVLGFFGMSLVSIILASLIRVNPVFLPFFAILIILIVILGGFISNGYEEASQIAQLTDEANKMVMMSYIFAYLPWIVLLISLVLMYITYRSGRDIPQ